MTPRATQPAPTGHSDQKSLPGLQLVRAAAAIMVVADHGSVMMALPKYFGRHPFSGVFESGLVGVDLFFVLSGFIIVHAATKADWTAKDSVASFLHKRFVRIVPFLWFVVIGYGLLRITARGVFPLGAYLRALVLWPVGAIEPTVVWTLRHEMLFYGVFALSFLGARKRPWLLVIWALSPLVAFPMRSQVGEGVYGSGELFRFVFHPVNLLFGAGVLTAYVFRRVSGRMAVRTTWMATLAGLVLVAAVSLALHYDRKSLAHVPVIGLFCSLAIFLSAGQGDIPGRLGRLGILLGDASYSIYLTHLAAVSALLGLAARFPAYFPDALLLAECVIGSCVFGTLVHLMVEKPLLRWLRHHWTPSAGRARPSPKPELA